MTTTRLKPDAAVREAVDLAREAVAAEAGAAAVGEHLAFVVEGLRLGTHYFECLLPGYPGWRWAVTLTRASRQKAVTIDEVVLLPGDEAVTAPDWLPWRERIQPGDLSPGDLLPVAPDDPRLVPTYLVGDDVLDVDDRAQIRQVAAELGFGRVRTLSLDGIALAAQRWHDGPGGPDTPLAKAAPATCWSCGFLIRIAGALSTSYGVCANGDANDDGRVVSLHHGCGAHSEVALARRHQPQALPDHVFDTVSDLETW